MIGMSGAKQSRRVSWAPNMKLCQVRLFLPEDAPLQSGLGTQDHLQAKASWLLHSNVTGSDDSLPPGFEAPHPIYQFKIDISQIPITKWKCPPRIVLNPEWLVVAGEESEEVAIENQRELGVLEAIYPRQSTIPPNPCVSSEVEFSSYDDSETPIVPIVAIEDEDTSEPMESSESTDVPDHIQPGSHSLLEKATPPRLPDLRLITEQLQRKAALPCSEIPTVGTRVCAEPDVLAAASAAFTAIMRTNEEGSLIDRDLLIKILSDPALVEKLLTEYGGSRQTLPAIPPFPAPPPPRISIGSSTPFAAPPTSQLYPITNMVPPPLMVHPPLVGNRHPTPVSQMPTSAPPSVPPVKDINYYKSLIQQHGGEKQEILDLNPMQFGTYPSNSVGMKDVDAIRNGPRLQRDSKPKIPKPCAYFNSRKGCRRGASCLYLHDGSIVEQNEDSKVSKRMKIDRGIAGRNG
ncbi:zinc finger CCCH domain-containing protein 30 [Typha latifolia]|uniref:zinc finger CCCH domain-containing protein 30 n=1 Tax=Typha latifolia TaxID=4733 RepID=UPI003C2D513A